MNPQSTFVHVLLYECSRCGAPASAVVTSDKQNVEEIDSRETVQSWCSPCGKGEPRSALDAKRHWVGSWEATGSRARTA